MITVVLIRYHFFLDGLESELSLRNIAKDSCDDVDNSIGNGVDHCIRPAHRHNLQQHVEELNEQVGEQNKGGGCHHVSEELNAPVKVGFRENNVPR